MKCIAAGLLLALGGAAAAQGAIPSFVHPGVTVVYEGFGAATVVPVIITVDTVSGTTVTGTTMLQNTEGGQKYSWSCTTGKLCQYSPALFQGGPAQFWVDPGNPILSITPSLSADCGEPWTSKGALPEFDFANITTYSAGHLAYTDPSNGASCGIIYDQTTGIIVDFDEQLPSSMNFQIVLFSKIGGFSPTLAGVTDFAGTGKSNILWQHDNGLVDIWLMNGISPTGAAAISDPGPDWRIAGVGDFDGDGKTDILLQSVEGLGGLSGKAVQVWLMNGTKIKSVLNLPRALTGYNIVGVADFNRDGKSDILWQNAADGQLVIWLMNGTALPQQIVIPAKPGASWHVVGVGDFTGSGQPDILWQNDSGQAAVWLMNSTTPVASAAVGGNPGTSWHIVAAADFNGDHKADILWQGNSGRAVVWLMNGTKATSSTAVGPNLGPGWHVTGVGDLNGDGKADILWQNLSGQLTLWLMNGTEVTGTALTSANPGAVWHVAAD